MTNIFKDEVAFHALGMAEFNLDSTPPEDVFSLLEDVTIVLQDKERVTLTRVERVALKAQLKAMLPKAWEAVRVKSGEEREDMRQQYKAMEQIIEELTRE